MILHFHSIHEGESKVYFTVTRFLFIIFCYLLRVEWIPIFIPDCSPAFASAPFKCWTEPNTHTLSLIDQRDSCGFEN